MKLRDVVVVYKRSSFDLYANVKKDGNFLRLVRTKSPVVHRFLPSHKTHEASRKHVSELLARLGIRAHFVHRAKPFSEKGIDLVITVGGDGTFLDASHSVKKTPILGLNSNPDDSVGMFCGATVETLEKTLSDIQGDRISPLPLARLALFSKGHRYVPVLNDLLVANTNPAATSRFILEIGSERREWKCSGLWVSPPAGSTAGIRSAGGTILPIRSRRYQFVVREPYFAGPRQLGLARKVLGPDDQIVIRSKMRTGGIYIDGSHRRHAFALGETLRVCLSPHPLLVFAYDERRRRRFS